MSSNGSKNDDAWGIVVLVVVVVVVIVGAFTLYPIYSRYQSRQDRNQHRHQALLDANNEVTINSIRIRTYQQRVKIATQQADIRYQNAIGIKRAQDEISSTLTPLYVQFEEIEAQKEIAVSGRNATVIYVPVGIDGRPIVQQTAPVTGVAKP